MSTVKVQSFKTNAALILIFFSTFKEYYIKVISPKYQEYSLIFESQQNV